MQRRDAVTVFVGHGDGKQTGQADRRQQAVGGDQSPGICHGGVGLGVFELAPAALSDLSLCPPEGFRALLPSGACGGIGGWAQGRVDAYGIGSEELRRQRITDPVPLKPSIGRHRPLMPRWFVFKSVIQIAAVAVPLSAEFRPDRRPALRSLNCLPQWHQYQR